jgi:hypothetical protein
MRPQSGWSLSSCLQACCTITESALSVTGRLPTKLVLGVAPVWKIRAAILCLLKCRSEAVEGYPRVPVIPLDRWLIWHGCGTGERWRDLGPSNLLPGG